MNREPWSTAGMSRSYRLVKALFRLFFRLACRLRVEGMEKVPSQGALILLTNHLHFLDPPLVMAVFPRQSSVLVAEKWERRLIINTIFRSIGAVFVDRYSADVGALRKVERLLRRGAVVGIAPEGTRSRTGSLQEGKAGAAFLASVTGATLLPVVMHGQEKVFEALRRLRRAEVVVHFGDPFTLPPLERHRRREHLQEMTHKIMLSIVRLLPADYRGVYAERLDVGEGSAISTAP